MKRFLWHNSRMTSTPIRVLLADDHALVRRGIREFLEISPDIQVLAEASDGAEALRLMRELQPDVAVLDIQMPAPNGIEVTRQARAEHLPIGILILTAYEDPPYIKAVLQAGANGYVLKNVDAEDLIEAVRAVHEGKSVLDPVLARKVLSNSAPPPDAEVEPLSDRELDVLRLAATGLTNKAIGVALDISDRTVQGHLAKIYDKLHAASRTEAVMRAVSLGWLPPTLAESL